MTNFTIDVVIFCAIIYTSTSSLSQSVSLNLDDLSFVRGFQLQSGVFYAFEPVGVLQCIRECKLRSKCRIIGWRSQKCELGENVSARSPSTNRKDFVSQMDMWSQSTVGSIMGTCDLHKCPNGNVCVKRSNGLSICMTSACPDPPIIRSSETPTAIRTVSSQFFYECADGSAGCGDPRMTCKPDGTWTPTTFSCQSLGETTEITSPTKPYSGIMTDVSRESETSTEKRVDNSKQEETATTVTVSLASNSLQASETDSTLKTSADRVSRSAFESLTTKQPGCKDSYSTASVKSKTICYNIYNDVTDTYDGAKTRCIADGAELMIIRTSDKIKALKRRKGKSSKSNNYFVDGSDIINEGVWKHSDGSMVEMSLFKSSPGKDASKNCVIIRKDRKFQDGDCANANGFICEILVS